MADHVLGHHTHVAHSIEALNEQCDVTSEADAQRFCGDLYITHGLESACGCIMFFFFAVVAVKLHARSHLKNPARAFLRFCGQGSYDLLQEFCSTISTVHLMPQVNLEVRLRFCGNIDKMTNLMSAWLSLLGITRWLSIGNINGMRYIGYGLTCPLTQLELVVLLAPIVPCYKLTALFSFLITFMTLMAGYAASLMWMPLWEGDFLTYIKTRDVDDLMPTAKLRVVSPAFVGICVLSLGVIPYLLTLYKAYGGARNPDLPQGYICMLMLVWCTWNLFPIWWMLSWEGMSVITDTKFNEIGFTLLNIIAKGSFTLQGFRMGAFEERRRSSLKQQVKKGKNKRSQNRPLANGKRNGNFADWSQQEFSGDLEDGQPKKPKNVSDRPDLERIPTCISRKSSRKLSTSLFVQILRDFDTAPREDYLGSFPEDRKKVKQRQQQVLHQAQAAHAASCESKPESFQLASYAVPTDERPDFHNPWFRSCLQNHFRPVVSRRPGK